MNTYSTNSNGDIEINNELIIPIGEIIAFLESDPRFEQMLLRVLTKYARNVGNLFDKWAQKPVPLGVVPQPTGTKRLT